MRRVFEEEASFDSVFSEPIISSLRLCWSPGSHRRWSKSFQSQFLLPLSKLSCGIICLVRGFGCRFWVPRRKHRSRGGESRSVAMATAERAPPPRSAGPKVAIDSGPRWRRGRVEGSSPRGGPSSQVLRSAHPSGPLWKRKRNFYRRKHKSAAPFDCSPMLSHFSPPCFVGQQNCKLWSVFFICRYSGRRFFLVLCAQWNAFSSKAGWFCARSLMEIYCGRMRERAEKTSLLSLALCSGDGRWTTFRLSFISIPIYVCTLAEAYLGVRDDKKRERKMALSLQTHCSMMNMRCKKYFSSGGMRGSRGLAASFTERNFLAVAHFRAADWNVFSVDLGLHFLPLCGQGKNQSVD